ncbi:MAG: hypothetical protein HXX19_13705 [Rhodoferax sp.]|nr:hypothetical protein [Rhodoferax sp.]
MKPMLVAGLVVLALTLVLAVAGVLLARFNLLRVRNAASYTRICTLLVLAATYGLTQYDWPGVHLRQIDFLSLMVIIGIAAYALIWAPIAHQLNQKSHDEFAESMMLSMLHHDAAQAPQPAPAERKADSRQPR